MGALWTCRGTSRTLLAYNVDEVRCWKVNRLNSTSNNDQELGVLLQYLKTPCPCLLSSPLKSRKQEPEYLRSLKRLKPTYFILPIMGSGSASSPTASAAFALTPFNMPLS
jgi:hypothetical protein